MRLGIALRLFGVLILGSLVILEGGAIKNHAFTGKSEHYTVVLKADANAKEVAADHAKQGVKVENIVNENGFKAYVASMPAGKATDIREDVRVAYMSMDSQKTYHNSLWDTTLITLGVASPNMN